MNLRPLFGGVALFASILGLVQCSGPAYQNPPVIYSTSKVASLVAAHKFADPLGYKVYSIDTSEGSMEPLMRRDGCYVATVKYYADVKVGDICVYMGQPDENFAVFESMCHRAVRKESAGSFIMSGDNNRYSEFWHPMTPGSYMGTVVQIFEVQ